MNANYFEFPKVVAKLETRIGEGTGWYAYVENETIAGPFETELQALNIFNDTFFDDTFFDFLD